METNRGAPTPPIAFPNGAGRATARLTDGFVEVDDELEARLAAIGANVTRAAEVVNEASRDWWPLGMIWALDDHVAARASVVARPDTAEQISEILRACNDARVPVTAAAGRSGVCGASVPAFGGVLLDLTGLAGIRAVDHTSMLVDVLPGTFGDVFEDQLRAEHGVTSGHWPQSMALSTVGGWLACRGAGQLSTRYGKIEDIVTGLDVVLADGTTVTTGGAPRAAVGPDLTQLFVGSEGTLGIIVGARLRVHPSPAAEGRAAYAFTSFVEALDVMRRVVQRGATPAVLRLYDAIEADRSYHTGDANVLLVLDEGDAHIVDATMRVVAEECATADPIDVALVEQWMEHRNDVSALEALIQRGFVVDTMEISAPWGALSTIYERTTEAMRAVEHTLVASAHQSHSYTDGGCLYFTFAGRPPEDQREAYYRAIWDAGQRSVLEHGGALSHHHGVGLNRARFLPEALGAGFHVLTAVKQALDPNGILNPGKLGLPTPFGALPLAVTAHDRVLVLDIGTSSVRAAIVRADGTTAHEVAHELLPDTPSDGIVEFDATVMARTTLEIATAALDAAGPVDAVGISDQRASVIVWDRNTSEPIGPGIGWQDLRTVGECLALRAQGLRLAPNQSATKVKWLLDQFDPDRARDLCFGTVDTWITWALTNGAAHVTDATNAAVTGLQRTTDHADWEPKTLQQLGIPQRLMPPIVDSTGVIAPATALPGAPPIAAILGDQQASLIGQGGVHHGDAKITFGTGAMLDLTLGTTPPAFSERGKHGTFPIIAWREHGRATYGIEAIMLAAGTSVQWLRDDLQIIDSSAQSHDLAASVPDTGGVVFVPALLGLGTPVWDYGARGALFGLTRGTTRAHIVRAVLEGIAQRGADLVEAAEADAGIAIPTLRVDGGMTENPTFVQALADATQRPVEISPVLEATTLGAALMAGLAVGHHGSVAELAGTWSPRARVEPNGSLDRARWQEAVARAGKWIPALSGIDF